MACRQSPIISGEWGYSTFSPKGVTREMQAAFLVRQQLANLLAGIPISIWYDWKDDGPDPAEREHNFGTVAHELTPKPAYVAIQTLARELSGYRIERRLPTASADDFVLLLANGTARKLAAWTIGEPRAVAIDGLTFKAARSVAGDGLPAAAEFQQGTLSLRLSSMPQYVTLTD